MLRLFTFLFVVSLSIAAEDLRVGVGRADITPIAGEHQVRAMGGGEVTVEKIHDPLLANVIIFEQDGQRVALVSLELIGYSNENWDKIRAGITAETGIEQIICAVTHTHGSGHFGPDAAAYVVEQALAAAREAAANMQPARIGYGRGEINEGYNRRIVKEDGTVEMMWNNRDRVPSEPVDDELGVISIRSLEDDRTIATLVNYAVHPVISMNFSELIVSADWPGVMARKVEAAVGGNCIFLLAAAGDINPYDADMFRYATPEETFAAVDRVGGNVAAEVLASIERIDRFHTETPLAFDRFLMPMAVRTHGLHAPKEREIELITFLIGQRFGMVTFAGELFVELGMDLKRRSPAEATWVVANAYDSSWYLPTMEAACQGGYGASSGTILEVGAGERMVTQALVSLRYQMDLVKPLQQR